MAQVKTSPNTARVITINHGAQSYEIIPNGKDSQFVEVPDEVLEQQFAKHLIDSGDLIVKASPKAPKKDLRAEAKELGIDFDGRTSDATLQKKIDEAKAAK